MSERFIYNEKFIYDRDTCTLTVKEGVRGIAEGELPGISISEARILIISSSVLYIGSHFLQYEDALSEILFQDNSNLEIIEAGAFSGNNINEIILPNSCRLIGTYAFCHCSTLKSIKLANVKYIGSQAFYGCSSLKEVEIPISLEYADEEVFYDCESLEKIYLPKSVKNRCDGVEKILTKGNSAEIILVEDDEIINASTTSSNPEIPKQPDKVFIPPTNVKRYDGAIRQNLLTNRKNNKKTNG